MLSLIRILLVLALGAWSAYAQSTFATLTGSVVDPSGAVVPNANISARDVNTNYVYKTNANDSGNYTLANLRDGKYTLRADAPGFQDFLVDNVILAGRDNRRIDIKFQVGSLATVVEIQGGGQALIETETAQISDVKDKMQLRTLPLTLRRVHDYLTLTPQIERNAQQLQPTFAGSRLNQGTANIDGTTVARSTGGFATGLILDRVESMDEMRVDVGGANAEFGTIGQVNTVSRGGTNQIHGVAGDYYNTTAFRARDPFQAVKGSSVVHALVFMVGGPVVLPKIYNGRDKTFFNYTEQRAAGSPTFQNINQSVPSNLWRQGNFSDQANVIYDPFSSTTTTRSPFPGNIIPASSINSTAKAFQDRFLVKPNQGDTFFQNNYKDIKLNPRAPSPTRTVRIDHRFGDRAFVFGRLSTVDSTMDNWEAMPTLDYRFDRARTVRTATVAFTYTLSASLLNETRWGMSYDNIPLVPKAEGLALVKELGIQGLAPDLPDRGQIPRITFTGISLSAITANQYCNPCQRDVVQQFHNNLTWMKSNHTVKTGFQFFSGLNSQLQESADLYGTANFSSNYTQGYDAAGKRMVGGHAYADFLLGIPTALARAFPDVEPSNKTATYSAFIQDDWKVSRQLTLNLGMRYEVLPGWTEGSGRMSVFDVTSGKIVVPDGSLSKISKWMPAGYVGVVEASQAGYDARKLVRPDKNNFAPRFGFAYRPFGNRTVIRGGIGIYHDPVTYQPSSAGSPYVIAEPAYTNPTVNPVRLPTFYVAPAKGPTTVALPAAFSPNIHMPYSMSYSFTLEREQWNTGFRLGYTGTNTRHGIYRWNINQPPADERPYSQKKDLLLFPNYPGINYTDNGAGHQYHGLTFQAQRRFSKGFSYQAYYTLAKDIQDLETNGSPENAFNRAAERGTWGGIPRQRWSGNVIYDLPFGKGRPFLPNMPRVAQAVFGGWQISGIYTYATGTAVTPTFTAPDPTGTAYTGTANARPSVTRRPDRLADGRLEDPTIARWFDTSAFAIPGLGNFGNSGTGIIYGPPSNVMHGTVSKSFSYKERMKLTLQFLATNAFNHPNYQNPNMSINTLGSSAKVSTVVDRNIKLDSGVPREMLAYIKLEW